MQIRRGAPIPAGNTSAGSNRPMPGTWINESLGSLASPIEQRQPGHALVADGADFRRRPIPHHGHDGAHATVGKADVRDGLAPPWRDSA